jgi:Fe-S-cluster containining protein
MSLIREIKNEVMELCNGCPAPCCYLKAVPLTEEEALQEVFQGATVDLFGSSVLKLQSNGACHFLDVEAGLCSIWDKRPYTCRHFSCQEHGV